jgi:hypothetical protein
MTDEMPLDLHALAEVESPEVISSALRAFRRRALRTALAVLVSGALAGAIVVAVRRDPFAADRAVKNAPGYDMNATYQANGVTASLVRVASLPYGSGLHLVVIVPPERGQEHNFAIEIGEGGAGTEVHPDGAVFDLWSTTTLPSDGRFDLVVRRAPKCADEKDLGGGLFTCTRFESGVRTPGDPLGDRELARFHFDLKALGVPHQFWVTEGGK